MFGLFVRRLTGFALLLSMVTPAIALARPHDDAPPAEPGQAAATTKQLEPEIPHCTRAFGTVAINEPDNQWWRALQLGSPSSLIRVIVTRSGCFRVVNRGTGLAMRSQERGLGDELQRGSNVGAGQIKSADFFLVPDLVGANSNAGGQGIGAALGGLFGGGIGGLLGGIRSKKSTARTVLTLVNARTTEELFSAEGQARKSDISFAVGGFGGAGGIGGGAVGGGYTDTEVGRVISAAYVAAYSDLVRQMQSNPPNGSIEAPKKAYHVVRATGLFNRPGGKLMKTLNAGDVVYPTGERAGAMIKVADEFDIEGWVTTEAIRG